MAQVMSRAMKIVMDISGGRDYKVDKYGSYVWSNKQNKFLTIARYADSRYKVVKISNQPILMHRLVAYMYSPDGYKLVQPNCDVRFMDGDLDNLSYDNLMVVEHETVGVTFNGKRWIAVCDQHYIGQYVERDDAMLMYDLYAQQNGRAWEKTNKLLPQW